MGGLSQDEAGAQGTFPRSAHLVLSRRARQIQADEGILPSPVNRPKVPDHRDASVSRAFDSARTNRGRARAGTLPSSWGDLPAPSLTAESVFAPAESGRFGAQTGVASGLVQYPQSRLALHQHQPAFADPKGAFDTAQTNNRIRSGSLTLPDDGFGNAFGPSIFSTWQPSRSGLSSLAMAADNGLGPHLDGGEDDYASRDTFDESSTLDYLGLADGHPRQSDAGSASLRHRASTLASSAARPRLSDANGRARSSSFLPGFNFEHVQERDESVDQAPSQPSATFAASPIHDRFGSFGGSLSPDVAPTQGLSSGFGARPRATSMGGLDGTNTVNVGPSPPGSATLAFEIDEDAIRRYAVEQNIDPNDFVTFAQTKALRASFSHGPPAPMVSQLAGRHRAGTIAALSGPGGRQRTEQELTRMLTLSPNAGHHRNARPQGLGGYLDATVNLDSASARGHSASASATTTPNTPNGQAGHPPSRSLYIGQLSPSTTGQDFMQAFAPYGAIDTLRLLPEKECGFINFVDMQDAISARDDIMNRLGGKIGLRTTSADGAIRIGFGKVEAIPQTGGSGLHGGSGTPSRDYPSPRPDQSGGDAPFASAADGINDQPTRALWVGSIPASTPLSDLLQVFAPFGPIESVRVLGSKNCGFINFERVDDAVRARKALHGRDILGAKVGGVRIGYAKVPSSIGQESNGYPSDASAPDFCAAVEALSDLQGASAVPVDQQLAGGNMEEYRSNLVLGLLEKQRTLRSITPPQAAIRKSVSSPSTGRIGSFPTHSSSNSIVPSSDKGGVPLPADMKPQPSTTDWQLIIRHLDEQDPEVAEHIEAVAQPRSLATYYTKIPLVSDTANGRKFDTSKLRELRKSIEASSCTQSDIDRTARDFLPDIVDLSSDFIGNTLVQKFFDRCSEALKVSMLESIAPHLAKIGIHKNGTWAAQKIIDRATTDEQRSMIAEHLRPYVPPLLTDQFGNYVVQKVIPFGSPHSDFIFDAMVDRCWEVAQGRFGARSMRAVLESSQASKLQQKRVAAAIVLNSVPLATSQNGALLMTWLLDSTSFPGRFGLLTPRFTPHLVHLCTHKLASLTLLRIITQTVDPEASRRVLSALLDADKPHILEEIVTNQLHGSQFVFRLLASNALDAQTRAVCAGRVTELLVRHRLLDAPPYRPLVENLGLAAARPPPPPTGPFMPAPALAPPTSALPYGQAALPRAHSQPFGDETEAASVFAPNGVKDLTSAMAQASLQGTLPPSDLRGPRAGRPLRPSLFPGITEGGGGGGGGGFDFAERGGRGVDGRRSQSYQSNAGLRSPTMDAFNPWARANAVGSPDRAPPALVQPHLMPGGDAQHLFLNNGSREMSPYINLKAPSYSPKSDAFTPDPAYGSLLQRSAPAYGFSLHHQHQHHQRSPPDRAAHPY
ncbi:related to JSN1 - RNA-binding protein (pumilio family) [Pseudozyma flocculosa]|uniref:Related to JSN1 - RNA-binding protein (Pumilio family) n=1 Tax=Pseudozyma flocculosa TaxID=84751 RepID=A0A5C3EQN6_9BASI|nr:related to JSN1 - RNA-binding protein (pumilio family) [Pseudozyma flocculosa]